MSIHRALVLLLVLAAACRSDPPSGAGTSTAARDYVWVELVAGPKAAEKSAEERTTIQAGHMANIQRLARERELLVAGPFAEPRRDPARRGLFIFAADSIEKARELTATDPAIEHGVMAMDMHVVRTAAPLRACLERVLALDEEAKRAGRERPLGEGMRAYVWLVAEHGDVAERELAPLIESRTVLMFGRFDRERAVALLDATDLAAAQALIAPIRERLGAHAFDPWFATSELASLPELAAR